MHDKKLISLIKKRDEECIVVMSEKYEKLLYHIAYGILGNREQDIEECINDTYLKFWKSIESYDLEKASVKTYLKIILRNTALNKLRDLSKNENNVINDDLSDIAITYVDESQNVENTIVKQEQVDILNEIIGSLSKRDREVAIRRFFYLQTSKEISRAMLMTVSAVDSRISRVRIKIKNKFEEYDYE